MGLYKGGNLKNLIVLPFLFIIFEAHSAEVTLYAINSPKRLDWSTPRSLLTSTIKSYARLGNGTGSRHKIGHAYLGFKCDGQEEIISGMTSGPGFGAKQSLFQEKVGLSVILTDNPGAFQGHGESSKDVNDFVDSWRMNALKLKISNEKCLKLQEWYTEYSSQEKFIYGGVDKRPLKGEGAGCTAYAMSYFEYADIDFDFFNNKFLRTVFLPRELVGGEIGDKREVPLKTILKNKTNLSLENVESLRVDLYDPNDMYYWIQEQWLEYQRRGQTKDLSSYNVEISLLKKMKIISLSPKE